MSNFVVGAMPSRFSSLVFFAKSRLLMLRRLAKDRLGGRLAKHGAGEELAGTRVIGGSATPLWTSDHPSERRLMEGKVKNLQIAAARLDGVEVGAGELFSFWRQVGRATARRGFVEGRELREGCLIPAVGGGLCQLSNALYDAALAAGFEIVERHAHTKVIAGSLAEKGRDATVFWPYVDLRFKAPQAFRIEAEVTDEDLVVRLRAETAPSGCVVETEERAPDAIGGCDSCGVTECYRHIGED